MSQQELTQQKSHWQIIEPVKRGIYVAMAFSVASVVVALSAIYTLAHIVRDYVEKSSVYQSGMETSSVNWSLFMLLLGLTFVAFILRGISFKRSHLSAFALEPILRQKLTQHLAKVSLGTLSEKGSGALSKVILDDVRDIHVFVADSTPLYARSYASPLLTLVFLVFIDWRLALVALGILVVGMLILSSVMTDSKALSEQYNQAREDVNRSVVEFVQAMPVVRTFDGGQTSFGRYEHALDRYLDILVSWYRRSGKPARLSMVLLNPMPTLVILLWAGAYWLWQDSLAFSTWLAVLLIGTGMAEALMPFMALYHMIEKSKISVNRIHQIMDSPTLPISDNPQQPKDASVVFENVDFRYQSRQENALTNVNFTVAEGSFTALVGASGAGKSTVARLIPRFWDANAGSVKVGGVDVRDILPDVLMQQVAFVFQDNFLFSGSITDNVLLGQDSTDDKFTITQDSVTKEKNEQAVIDACKMAQAHDFIMQLPDGYDTQVGERGASLSGGQRQRITIARAILQNRPILVLDEATAFADAENEALLMKALNALMKDKTVLMIAHRLATIQNADQILVFKQGKLAEAGAPKELLAKNGEYAQLWQAYQKAQNWTITN